MSVICIPPHTPDLYSKNWGMHGYTYFSYFLLEKKKIHCGYSLEPPQSNF